jgi:hypothetical protein
MLQWRLAVAVLRLTVKQKAPSQFPLQRGFKFVPDGLPKLNPGKTFLRTKQNPNCFRNWGFGI